MKVASWNVNSLKVRQHHVLKWLDQSSTDILAIQETKCTDENFPLELFISNGYQCLFAGQKTYNGVAILSRTIGCDVVTDPTGLDDKDRRVIAATFGDLRVINLYVVNGQAVGSEKYKWKLIWLERIKHWLVEEIKLHKHLVVVGDFNIAPDDRDVHDADLWRDKILCSHAERESLKAICDLGLSDCFRHLQQQGGYYSWWDYRAAGFRRNLGLRIDMILASTPLVDTCTECVIDQEPRTWERPSDHTPVSASFEFN